MSERIFDRVVIVGPGLIGGSLGIVLRERGLAGRVVGVGHRQASLDRAIEKGAVDETTLDAEAAASDADLVVLATRVELIVEQIGALGRRMKPGALLTDVGSVKGEICAAARAALGRHAGGARFVGGHPLAGSEQRGIDAACGELFEGALCILTPDRETDPDGSGGAALRRMWEAAGCRVLEFDPEEHDRLLAEVSHLPHLVAAALVNAVSEKALPLAASGFADTTRIASGDPDIWVDICLHNRRRLLETVRAMRRELAAFEDGLKERDRPLLGRLLRSAKRKRDGRAGIRGE